MWEFIVRFILRNRIALLVIILGITAFMGYKATKIELSYEMARMLPDSDPISKEYDQFKKIFGEDGSVIVVGVKDSNLTELSKFKKWYTLTQEIKKMEGIEGALSIASVYNLIRDDSLVKFRMEPVFTHMPNSQEELDSLLQIATNIKFYNQLLYNTESHSYILAVTLSKNQINAKSRIDLVNKLKKKLDQYSAETKTVVHCSGLPYIRTVISDKIKSELKLFIILSLIVAAIILVIVFKSLYTVIASLIIIAISLTWFFGSMVLFGYKITVLQGVIPTLLTIIAIENAIYLINKFHIEYKRHGNKIKGLTKVVMRIGFATLITNATTATGFAAFIFTSNTMLKEFGIIASINVMLEYMLSIILIPIIFSILPSPKEKHTQHLESKFNNTLLKGVRYLITTKRNYIYATSLVIIVVCLFGVFHMKISGRLVDDIPKSDKLYKDLKFFENNFGGVLPLEITIDTKQPNGIFADDANVLYKIRKVHKLIQKDSLYNKYFSKPLSIYEAVRFANQAYNYGDAKYYDKTPTLTDLNNISNYLSDSKQANNNFKSFLDSTKQITRISIQMADVGSDTMNILMNRFIPKIDSIFNEDGNDYKVTVTGNSLVFTKGTEFLIKNLWESIVIGILIISLLMAFIFYSFRMIVIAMLVNLMPLLITAAIMGFFNIPVKPSTIIVFSIALGISVDNAILFLSRYRHELKIKKLSISESVLEALNDVSASMIYSSIVLVLGFAIFTISGFGGTKALGMLISLTLLFALFFNAIVLPALLLTLDKYLTTPAFKEPVVNVYDEDDESENDTINSINTDKQ